MIECSCSSARGRALVLMRACTSYVARTKPHKLSFFGFLLFVPSAVVKWVGWPSFFLVTPRLALFRSTPSLAGTQQQLKHQHLRLHQQECGSAAAAPTARMRRVQQPILHVSSSISRDCCICLFCAVIRVRVSRCVRVCVLEPHISAFCFFCSACCYFLQLRTLLLCLCGPLL